MLAAIYARQVYGVEQEGGELMAEIAAKTQTAAGYVGDQFPGADVFEARDHDLPSAWRRRPRAGFCLLSRSNS